MSFKSEGALALAAERRTADRVRTLERHAGRVSKVQTRVSFGGAR